MCGLLQSVRKHFIVKAASNVNSGGEKGKSDEDIIFPLCVILAEVGVFAFYFYNRVIFRFHKSSLTVANCKTASDGEKAHAHTCEGIPAQSDGEGYYDGHQGHTLFKRADKRAHCHKEE